MMTFTPSTYNVPEFTNQMAGFLRGHFGDARVRQIPAAMGGEDFSQFYRADNSIQSLIFWVGGTPQAEWDAAQANGTPLPSLHSPFWAPDAEKVISTATEAMSAMAMEILKKG